MRPTQIKVVCSLALKSIEPCAPFNTMGRKIRASERRQKQAELTPTELPGFLTNVKFPTTVPACPDDRPDGCPDNRLQLSSCPALSLTDTFFRLAG
ncbi:hypothetical protein HPB52_001338 [Rhipicephalus sanguineus]|uniref:Uncharacterized protein n=1 Tax=Rhipicephalus sanguineus TaxID=34632 RepID=A0A9D4T6M7_RHISA|nr:hypothetical protein HPB52_001338 [Rhipicephalus sanguineus]